jgi:hypothetical protein
LAYHPLKSGKSFHKILARASQDSGTEFAVITMTDPKEQKMYPSEFSLSLTTLENFAFVLDVDVDTVGTHSASWDSASWDKKSLEYDCARIDWEAAELRFGEPWGFCCWGLRQI